MYLKIFLLKQKLINAFFLTDLRGDSHSSDFWGINMANKENELESVRDEAAMLGVGCLVMGATVLVSPVLLAYEGYMRIREKFNRKYHLKQEVIRARRHLDYVQDEAEKILLSNPHYNARQAIETAEREVEKTQRALEEFEDGRNN